MDDAECSLLLMGDKEFETALCLSGGCLRSVRADRVKPTDPALRFSDPSLKYIVNRLA